MCKLLLSLALIAAAFHVTTISGAQEISAPTNSTGNVSTKLIDVSQAEKLLADKKVKIIDVRTPQEFARGHLNGSTNLDFHGKDFTKKLEELDKQQAYLVHCAVGGRSARACKLMDELGFKSVYDLKGGIQAWEKAGKSLEK